MGVERENFQPSHTWNMTLGRPDNRINIYIKKKFPCNPTFNPLPPTFFKIFSFYHFLQLLYFIFFTFSFCHFSDETVTPLKIICSGKHFFYDLLYLPENLEKCSSLLRKIKIYRNTFEKCFGL
jgi:hypothetical protein